MKKTALRLVALLFGAVLLISTPMTASADEGYTYIYDWWGDIQYSPDAYEVAGVFTKDDLGLDTNLNNPSSMFVYKDEIYVCDSGNNRILVLKRDNADKIECVKVIDQFYGDTDVKTFLNPTDIAVDDDGNLYIADNGNHRIVKFDKNLQYLLDFTRPVDATFDQNTEYLPNKIVIDSAGRVFCIATNVNKGLIKYEADGTFSGFVGATPVTYDFMDYIWKRLATKAQREQMVAFVPTEYANVYMDRDGFVYATTTNVTEEEVDDGKADPIRKINMMGKDILIRNGEWWPIGDIYWGNGGGYEGPSKLVDITVMDNDVYVALDRVRGKIFAYNSQGVMLFAFGGNGNQDGYFRMPASIEHMGYDLLVLDSVDNSITLFTPTVFGKMVYQAMDEFKRGEYEASGETWKKVKSFDGNYDLAYIGIGRSLLRQENYKDALTYFELKWDDENYSRAFQQYRKVWVEENIGWIFAAVFLLLIVPLCIGKVKKIKHEIDIADIFRL
ncbi:MAG TPA: NHL repeat-containing protein [Lachnospiraceae bacterium]|nr:NHL repeat-containing protein [Lachnospiraceae bacterium]